MFPRRPDMERPAEDDATGDDEDEEIQQPARPSGAGDVDMEGGGFASRRRKGRGSGLTWGEVGSEVSYWRRGTRRRLRLYRNERPALIA